MTKQFLSDEAATCKAAQDWASRLKAGDCLTLSGPLGAGKSVFARALMRALGVRDHAIPSPSFSLIQLYATDTLQVAHMDWYRLSDRDEVLMLGVDDYFSPPWVSIIEWAERAPELLPDNCYRLHLSLDAAQPNGRWLDSES